MVMGKVENLDSRMSALGKKLDTSILSYAAVVSSNPVRPDSEMLEKLEYFSSDEERKLRIFLVTVTHPSINPNNNDSKHHAQTFFSTTMKTPAREMACTDFWPWDSSP